VDLRPVGPFIEPVKADPEVAKLTERAKLTFRAASKWQRGTKIAVSVTEPPEQWRDRLTIGPQVRAHGRRRDPE
jgi:hypothetical protein